MHPPLLQVFEKPKPLFSHKILIILLKLSTGGLNDLWYYNVSSSEWNWMGGSDSVGATGNYGTRGVGSVDNIPGARDAATTWIDSNDNLWLFGGLNFAASSKP